MPDQPVAYAVDDEPAMLAIIAFTLETQGFRVETFESGAALWEALRRNVPDIVILDVMMPSVSGVTLCQRVKANWDIPVMLVTAKSDAEDRVAGFEADADDYLGKPFHPRELALRAERLVSRSRHRAVGGALSYGPLRLNPQTHDVTLAGKAVTVTATEFKLLATLITANGAVVGFTQLLLAAWGEEHHYKDREMIKAAIYRLRLKFEDVAGGSSRVIEAVRGHGYRLHPDGFPERLGL